MFCRIVNIIPALFVGFSVMLLSSCTFEARGIPVKEFRPTKEAEAADIKQKKEMEKDIIMMSRVTEKADIQTRQFLIEGIDDFLKNAPQIHNFTSLSEAKQVLKDSLKGKLVMYPPKENEA